MSDSPEQSRQGSGTPPEVSIGLRARIENKMIEHPFVSALAIVSPILAIITATEGGTLEDFARRVVIGGIGVGAFKATQVWKQRHQTRAK